MNVKNQPPTNPYRMGPVTSAINFDCPLAPGRSSWRVRYLFPRQRDNTWRTLVIWTLTHRTPVTALTGIHPKGWRSIVSTPLQRGWEICHHSPSPQRLNMIYRINFQEAIALRIKSWETRLPAQLADARTPWKRVLPCKTISKYKRKEVQLGGAEWIDAVPSPDTTHRQIYLQIWIQKTL